MINNHAGKAGFHRTSDHRTMTDSPLPCSEHHTVTYFQSRILFLVLHPCRLSEIMKGRGTPPPTTEGQEGLTRTPSLINN